MTSHRWLLFLLPGLLLAECALKSPAKAASTKETIVGTWEPTDPKKKGTTFQFEEGPAEKEKRSSYKFTGKGKIKITFKIEKTITLAGDYELNEDNTLEISLRNPKNPKDVITDKMKIEITPKDDSHEMTIVNPQGKRDTLKKVGR